MSIYNSWLVSKEQEVTFRPTLLFRIVLTNGVEIAVTSPWGGATPDMDNVVTNFQGRTYNATVVDTKISSVQSQSGNGVDNYGSITLVLTDANARYYLNEVAFGFGAATMFVDFALYDPDSDTFSPDSQRFFVGTCDPAQYDGRVTTITAVSTYTLAKEIVPLIPIQRNCPLLFPDSWDARNHAQYDPLSPYFLCGYSADFSTGLSGGNLDPNGQPYTTCTYDKVGCQARGMYSSDNQGRPTGRFAGVQWTPPATWKGGSYTLGKDLKGVNNENLAKYTQYAPLTYGETWTTGVNANVVGDPNSTRGEMIIASLDFKFASMAAWLDGIQLVVTNGLLTPHASRTSDLLFRWYDRTNGQRNGNPTGGVIYEGAGDPYGNLVTIIPIVYQAVANSNVNLDCKVLMGPRPIPVFSAPGVYNWVGTNSLAWVMYDIFRLFRPDLWEKIDLQSVINYAFACESPVRYRRSNGEISFHKRFAVALSITKDMSLNQLVEGLKMSGRLMIIPSDTGDKIRFQCRESIYDQQNAPIPGSNYNAPVPSYGRTEDYRNPPSGQGYIAYDFDESIIVPNSFRYVSTPYSQLPTVIQVGIQDEDNSYTPDNVRIACTQAFAVAKTKSQSTLQAIGVPNYDQAYRVANCKFAELWNGNPRGDWKGTVAIQFTTSFRAKHLTIGSIVRVRFPKMGLGNAQYFRVTTLSPSKDCSLITISATFHDDRWYTDSFSQLF